MSCYEAAMRQVIELHGGRVEKLIGDAVMGVFGIPVLYEDDALRAVRADLLAGFSGNPLHFHSSTTSGSAFLARGADAAEHLAPPVVQLLDPRVYQLRRRRAFRQPAPFHIRFSSLVASL
jgi:class 3 adenylate cyclase